MCKVDYLIIVIIHVFFSFLNYISAKKERKIAGKIHCEFFIICSVVSKNNKTRISNKINDLFSPSFLCCCLSWTEVNFPYMKKRRERKTHFEQRENKFSSKLKINFWHNINNVCGEHLRILRKFYNQESVNAFGKVNLKI